MLLPRRSALTLALATPGGLVAPGIRTAAAQGRRETLLIVSENPPNSTDIHGVGANRPAYEASWNLYDRLMTFGSKTDAQGNESYDYDALRPELAEDWDLRPMSVTFRLRRDARFHDGSPVTAHDVKWSFDRAVTVGGFPTFQMNAGSLERREQFVVVDDHTFRVDFLRRDKLTMPDLAVPVPVIINSGLARRHATEADPWAMAWLRSNPAGSGAFRLERWVPGQEMVFARNDAWAAGPRPALARVIWRIVPQAGNRRALLERGDADLSFDLPPKDFMELRESRRLKIVSTPVENALSYLGMNAVRGPFADARVRRAVAFAIPYERIMEQAMHGQGTPMFGGPAQPASAEWPQPSPFRTDLERARALLAEAGHANGFDTTLSFDLGGATVNEPAALAIAENLARIGIRAGINKVPGANWRAELLKKEMPLFLNGFGGWLNVPDYFFFWAYHGQNAVFNTSGYRSPAMDALIERARFEEDRAAYEEAVRGFVGLAWQDAPRAPLFQPWQNVAMQNSISGYRYWFHRQLDYRTLSKGA
ncbi:ABC transporter substrate-binding protein [Roseococcus sp. DSY-14]|uniref:ABC transporter substrate-binding protein n=1 Tax=Roseococcus sp. DSY-14 TaxID=3369650 RepID=UPI00387AF891